MLVLKRKNWKCTRSCECFIADRAYNFHKYGQEKIQHLGAAYDYGNEFIQDYLIYTVKFLLGSIMHYGKYAFAINDTVPTIITPPGVEIGQLSGLSRVISYFTYIE